MALGCKWHGYRLQLMYLHGLVCTQNSASCARPRVPTNPLPHLPTLPPAALLPFPVKPQQTASAVVAEGNKVLI